MVTGLMKHKNFENGVYGFFRSNIAEKYKLTIVGIDPDSVVNLGEYHQMIDWKWNIRDIELSDLYHQSVILLFPSTIEGFGIPLLEAMEFQVKICCSGNSVFPEICLDAATYFDPHSIADISRALGECDSRACPVLEYEKILNGYTNKSIQIQVNALLGGV